MRTRSRHDLLLVLFLVLGLCPSGTAARAAPLTVIATIPTYGALARELGGDSVDVIVICRPGQDMHSVTATPSLMARVRDADLLLYTGLDSELWLDGLLRGSGNIDLLPGGERAVALSDGITIKDVPSELSRSQGDVHAYGNPHVWADPVAVRAMAGRVAEALSKALPGEAAVIAERHAAFDKRLLTALVGWLKQYKHFKNQPVVVYHKSWIYLLDRFGLVQLDTIEPKPRVAPTASHLDELIALMRTRDCKVVVREPYQHPEAADFVADATGAEVVVLSTHPGYPEGVDDIIDHFAYNLAALDAALSAQEQDG